MRSRNGRRARTEQTRLSGVEVFEITAEDGRIPDGKARAAIQKQIAEHCYENLLIFVDAARTQSLWYWLKREGAKAWPRDHFYVKGQPGDLFLSKLASMVVDVSELDAGGNIAVTEVAGRLKAALDVERVTKKFYREFLRSLRSVAPVVLRLVAPHLPPDRAPMPPQHFRNFHHP